MIREPMVAQLLAIAIPSSRMPRALARVWLAAHRRPVVLLPRAQKAQANTWEACLVAERSREDVRDCRD